MEHLALAVAVLCVNTVEKAPKQHHGDNAGGDAKCHADDAVNADAAAADGAGEQGYGGGAQEDDQGTLRA